jgi:hypothetical protein
MPPRDAAPGLLDRVAWNELAVFLLGFGLVSYLGLEGGGYDEVVHEQVGIATWWLLLAGTAVAALPRRRWGRNAWVALGLLTAFVAWTALSLTWTESVESTFDDLARVSGYLGIFGLALLARGRDDGRSLLGGVAAGVVLVAGIGLLSRFHPVWFPSADETSQLLNGNEERLSYPIHYWNGLAALIAIGLPALLFFAAEARSAVLRALSAAAMPVLILAAFLTFSRGGIGSAVLALVVFLSLASNRLPKLLSLAAAGLGGLVLCLLITTHDALYDGLQSGSAESQGDEMIVWTILVCLAVAAAQMALSALTDEQRRPSWTIVPRRNAGAVGAVAAGLVVIGLLAFAVSGRAGDAWTEFKEPVSPGEGSSRLVSAAGQNRWSYWQSALDANATDPLRGTGSGTFEFWWTRDRDSGEPVLDTHSLYFQTLGEIGIVGLLLLLAFILAVAIGGVRAIWYSAAGERSLLAAALAGVLAFFAAATVDWLWQIPVLVAAMLLLASLLVLPRKEAASDSPLRLAPRLGICAVAVVALFVNAIPLAATSQLRESEAAVRDGDLPAALEAARTAQNVEPGAAAPRLQQALVLELSGDLPAATEAAREATERGETNWRNWLVLARLEAKRGDADAALVAYRRARSLNPRSPIFDR